ncbi:MAG TPA: MBL fold metallo-hydrolase [Dehalococcoidia bacterium]|nr:MBL fold metallo-hydrolase [Dehalococcoidia bacterium]
MSNETYRFNVGKFECIAISDGTMTYAPPNFPPPASFLFSNAPKTAIQKILPKYGIKPEQWNDWTSQYTCLVIKTEKNKVLIDTGAGSLMPTTGRLIKNLNHVGIMPEDIDTVIITHGHPDHLGGNSDDYGNINFPKARWVMWKDEWEFWTSNRAENILDEHSKDLLVSIARKNLSIIQDRVDLIDTESEIVPGIKAIATPGHTPGHMAVEVSSNRENLFCLSDVVLHPIHMEMPEWYAAVDIATDQLISTRKTLLRKAAGEKVKVIAFHFPFPGLGYVEAKGKTWQWRQIV